MSENTLKQYVIYKRLRNNSKMLGKVKMARFFSRRLSELRIKAIGY